MVSHNKRKKTFDFMPNKKQYTFANRGVINISQKKNFKNGTEFKGRLKRKSIKSICDIKRFCFCGRRGVNKNK